MENKLVSEKESQQISILYNKLIRKHIFNMLFLKIFGLNFFMKQCIDNLLNTKIFYNLYICNIQKIIEITLIFNLRYLCVHIYVYLYMI